MLKNMKKRALSLLNLSFIACYQLLSALPYSSRIEGDLNLEIPEILISRSVELEGYERIPDVVQDCNSDWSNVIGMARNMDLEEAYEIAEHDPNITYFFYVKGDYLGFKVINEQFRHFRNGDAVFFSGEPCWSLDNGVRPVVDLSDGYVKLPKS